MLITDSRMDIVTKPRSPAAGNGRKRIAMSSIIREEC
jgi:hypothetical protein